MKRAVNLSVHASSVRRHERGLLAVADLIALHEIPGQPAIKQFALPIGNASLSREQHLEPGKYLAQVRLPTGKVLADIVEVSAGETTLDLVIGRPSRPNPNVPREVALDATDSALRDERYTSFPTREIPESFQSFRLPGPPASASSPPEAFSTSLPAFYSQVALVPTAVDVSRAESVVARVDDALIRQRLQTAEFRVERIFPDFFGVRIDREPALVAPPSDLRLTWRTFPDVGGEAASGRKYAYIRPADGQLGGRSYVACVPPEWSQPTSGERSAIRVQATAVRGSSDRLHVSVEVDDLASRSLLAFMQQGDLPAVLSILDVSIDSLRAKFSNPYAAAAAAYCLILAPQERIGVNWRDWIGNLANYFPDVPDGAILHATLLLQRAGYEEHRDNDYFPSDPRARIELGASLCLEAVCKGPPYYRIGLRYLASNLQILLASEWDDSQRLLLKNAERVVAWMNMRVNSSEEFTVIDVTPTGAVLG